MTFCAEFRWAISKFRWAISKSLSEIAQRNSAQNVVAFPITIFYLINIPRKCLFFAEGFCGRIPRKDFQCRISICGRVPRKDFAEGCGRIQKNKLVFCWPIVAERSLPKDSAEGFSMRNKHLWKDSAEGFRKDPRKDPRGRKKTSLWDKS